MKTENLLLIIGTVIGGAWLLSRGGGGEEEGGQTIIERIMGAAEGAGLPSITTGMPSISLPSISISTPEGGGGFTLPDLSGLLESIFGMFGGLKLPTAEEPQPTPKTDEDLGGATKPPITGETPWGNILKRWIGATTPGTANILTLIAGAVAAPVAGYGAYRGIQAAAPAAKSFWQMIGRYFGKFPKTGTTPALGLGLTPPSVFASMANLFGASEMAELFGAIPASEVPAGYEVIQTASGAVMRKIGSWDTSGGGRSAETGEAPVSYSTVRVNFPGGYRQIPVKLAGKATGSKPKGGKGQTVNLPPAGRYLLAGSGVAQVAGW